MLCDVFLDGVALYNNPKVLGKGLELLCANSGILEINHHLLEDDTALVTLTQRRSYVN